MKDKGLHIVANWNWVNALSGGVIITLGIAGLAFAFLRFSGNGFESGMLFLVFVSGGFIYFGSQMMFRLRSVVINRNIRTVMEKNKFLWSASEKLIPFESIHEVRITKVVRRSSKSTNIFYPVTLEGSRRVRISRSGNYNKSRQEAEKIAELMGLPIVDYSTGSEIIRYPDDLELPLYKQSLVDGTGGEIGPPPVDSGIEIGRSEDEVEFILPCRTQNFLTVGGLFLGIAILAGGFILLLNLISVAVNPSEDSTSVIIRLGFGIFMCFLFGYVIAALSSLKLVGIQTITVDPKYVTVCKSSPIARETQKMSMDEIEEVITGTSAKSPTSRTRGVILRGDKASLMLCDGQSKEILEWFERAMKAAIVSVGQAKG